MRKVKMKVYWFRIASLIVIQTFLFTTYGCTYSGGEFYQKEKKDLRASALSENPEKARELTKRLSGESNMIKDESILAWSLNGQSLENILGKIVKEYDVRGFDGYGDKSKYPQQFDAELLVWMGRGLGTAEFTSARHGKTVGLKPGDTFLMAGDNGPSTDWVKKNLMKGLTDTGVNVIDLGTCCSGELYSNISRLSAQGGLYVTRSHVEIGTNGFKPVIGGITLYGDMLEGLKKQVLSAEYRKAATPGTVNASREIRQQSRKMYTERLLKEFAGLKQSLDKNPMKIAVNFGGGSAVSYVGLFQELLGDNLVQVFRTEDDPYCEKGGLPDPSRSDSVALSNEKSNIMEYSRQNPDVAIINFDLDADRVSVVWGGKLYLGDEEFYPVVEYQLTLDQYKDLNKNFYYDSRMKTEIRDLIEHFGGVAKLHPKGHSKVKATMDLLLRDLAQKEGLSLEEFLTRHPGYMNTQSEYSLHMFLTNDRGEPFDDAVRFSLFWLQVFSGIKEKYNQPSWTLGEYVQFLKDEGIVKESVQLQEQRTPMNEDLKKEVMLQMERNVLDFFGAYPGFELIDNWEKFEGRKGPFTLVEVEGVFHLMTPLGDAFWGWSNTSPKDAFGVQATNQEDLKRLSEVMVALWVHARNQVAERAKVKLPVISDAETAALRKLFGYEKVENAAEKIEADCLKKYPDLKLTLAALASTGVEQQQQAEERYALNTTNLLRIEKDLEKTMEDISREGMLKALLLMSGKEKADLGKLKTQNPDLAVAIDKLAKISFDGDAPRLGWMSIVNWALNNPKSLAEITGLINEIRKSGARYIVFCGMGGSVLCVDTVMGTFEEVKDFPVMQTLSDTDPDGVKKVIDFTRENDPTLENTYVVVTTKSGTTAETLSHLEVWERALVQYNKGKVKLEDRVIVLTDPGSPTYENSFWQKRAENLKGVLPSGVTPYAKNPRVLTIQLDGGIDIGGRFTAPGTRLFLLAAGLRGQAIEALLKGPADLSTISEAKNNPYVQLGTTLYLLAQQGVDEVTLVLPPELKQIAPWAEQLFEESLGKEGKGLHIIYGEELGLAALKNPKDNDRIFLRFKVAGKEDKNEELVQTLREKGYPVIEQEIKNVSEITSIMYGLEQAVASVAYLWNINFVDQPAVVLYKNKTKTYEKKDRAEIVGDLKARKDKKVFTDSGITVYYGGLMDKGILSREALERGLNALGTNLEKASAEEVTAVIVRLIMDRADIKCLDTRYYGDDREIRPVLENWRNAALNIFRRATKVSKGPDINHSGEQNAVAGIKGLRLINVAVPDTARALSLGDFTYDDKLLIASALGTVDSEIEANRPALLITLADKGKEGISNLNKFYQNVENKISLSRWVNAFPTVNKKLNGMKLTDLKNKPRAVVINSQIIKNNPSIGLAIINANRQLGKEKGLKFVLAHKNPEAVESFYAAVNKATNGAVNLKGEFDLVVSERFSPKRLALNINNAFGEIEKIEVIGPESWLNNYQNIPGIKDCLFIVCEIDRGKTVPGDLALWSGLDALVDEGILTAGEKEGLWNLRHNQRKGFFMVKSQRVGKDVQEMIDSYREIVSSE